jgi:urea transport system substrate-binding protein
MLVGELPFQGSSAMAVMMALANKTPPPVNAANASIPQGVADLVSRLLEKDPARRPESAREVVATIEHFLGALSGNVPLPSPSARHAHVQPGGETLVPGRSDTLPPTPTPSQQPAPPASAVVSAPRRWKARATWGVVGLVIVAAAGFGLNSLLRPDKPGAAPAPEPGPAEPLVVGILHSQSGTMAVSEKPVIDSTLMAIDELNAAGGVLGRPVKAVVADGKSDPDEFARQAVRLIEQERAVALFGCWTSASRRAVREVLQQKNDGVLFYPVQYEGLGDSPRIVYLGPAPNQQIIPAVEYLTRPVADGGLGKKRIFLVGSDYLFPRVAHEIIRDQIALKKNDGVEVVGERFLPLGSDDATLVVAQIKRAEPDAIVNTLNGGTNFHFFRELRKDGFTPDKLPTLSLSITENEVGGLDPAAMAGNYLATSYFQTIDRPESREFLRKLRERNGPAQVATDPMAAAYTGVRVWAKAAEKAKSVEANAVLRAIRGMEFEGVRAKITIDAVNLHTWLPARLGRILPNGLVDLVPNAGSDRPIPPEPFPPTRTVAQWHQLLQSLQFKWNGRWQPPDPK